MMHAQGVASSSRLAARKHSALARDIDGGPTAGAPFRLREAGRRGLERGRRELLENRFSRLTSLLCFALWRPSGRGSTPCAPRWKGRSRSFAALSRARLLPPGALASCEDLTLLLCCLSPRCATHMRLSRMACTRRASGIEEEAHSSALTCLCDCKPRESRMSRGACRRSAAVCARRSV
jgi:hypothetical protein